MYVYILVIVYHDVLHESKIKIIKRAISRMIHLPKSVINKLIHGAPNEYLYSIFFPVFIKMFNKIKFSFPQH